MRWSPPSSSGRRAGQARGGMAAAAAEAGPLDDLQRAQAGLLRGQVALFASAGSEAPALLLQAARQLEPLDGGLARQTYLDAWLAAVFAGDFAQAGSLREVSRAARSAPPPSDPPAPHDLLLDALAVLVTDGRAAAARCCGGRHASSPRTRSRWRRDCAGAGRPR